MDRDDDRPRRRRRSPTRPRPSLRLSGATAQHPLRSGRITVSVRCPAEACAGGASATVAGVRLSSAPSSLRPDVAKMLTLRVSSRARAAIRRALRSKRSVVRTRVAVVAIDIAGNETTARRTIALRR